MVPRLNEGEKGTRAGFWRPIRGRPRDCKRRASALIATGPKPGKAAPAIRREPGDLPCAKVNPKRPPVGRPGSHDERWPVWPAALPPPPLRSRPRPERPARHERDAAPKSPPRPCSSASHANRKGECWARISARRSPDPSRMKASRAPVECLSVCKRPCTVALAAPGKWTYVVGDLDREDSLRGHRDRRARYAGVAWTGSCRGGSALFRSARA